MAHILALAPSISPDMLPVVSRQKTSSSATGLGGGAGAAAAGGSSGRAAAKRSRDAAGTRRDMGAVSTASAATEEQSLKRLRRDVGRERGSRRRPARWV